MNTTLVTPLAATVIAAVGGLVVHRVVPPRHATRVLAGITVLAGTAVLAALVLVTLAGASQVAVVADLLPWCPSFAGGGHGSSAMAGVAAALVLVLAVARAVVYGARVYRDRRALRHVTGLRVEATSEAVALAVPGRPGGIVLGSALVAALRPGERAVVIAHEQAHLVHRHHRYVYAAELLAASIPALRPLARRVRLCTERWADELAAHQVGSRRLVARTIAKVAVIGAERRVTAAALAASGGETITRVEALLRPHRSRAGATGSGLVALTGTAAICGAVAQAHHLAVFLRHACHL